MKIISKTFIYILLFVLTYFIYINPLLTLNTVGILNSTKNIHEFDVVVSHYKEDLSWLDNYLPENCRLFIYSKSNEKPNCKKKYIHKILKNVGRCDHTYLSHIILNYDKKLHQNTLFLPGSCDIWYKKLTLNLGLSHPVEIEVPDYITIKMDGNTKFTISSPDKQKLGAFAAMVRSKRPPEPFKVKGIRYSNEFILRKEGKKK